MAIEVWDRVELDGEKVMRSKPKNKFVSLSAEETAKLKKQVQPVFDRFIKLLDDPAPTARKCSPTSKCWSRSTRSERRRGLAAASPRS